MRVWVDDVRPMPDGYDVHIKTIGALYAFLLCVSNAGEALDFISFDHDMPKQLNFETVYDVLKLLDKDNKLDYIFLDYRVHSANPDGKQRIEWLMKDLFKKQQSLSGSSG